MSLLPLLLAERAKYGTLMHNDECVNAINTVCALAGGPWGLTGKEFGVGIGIRYDGRLCGHDTILNRDTGHIYDVFQAAGAASLPIWHDLGLHTQPHRPWIAPIAPRDPAAPVWRRTKLGAALFCLVDLFQHDFARCERSVTWQTQELGAQMLRIFLRKGTGDAGDWWLNEPYRSMVRTDLAHLPIALMQDVFHYVRERHITIAPTIFADTLRMTYADQARFRDAFIDAALPFADIMEYIEVINEPTWDGGGHGGLWGDVKRHMQVLRAAFGPSMLLAPGSPTVHRGTTGRALEEEIAATYGDCPEANLMTVHLDRWRDAFPEFGALAPSRRANSEPRGPGTSVRSVTDPEILRADFLRTQAHGYEWYVFSCDEAFRPRGRDVWQFERADDTAAMFRAVSQAPTPQPVTRDRLQPDEALQPGDTRVSQDGRFTLAYQGDGNLVLYHHGQARWDSRTWGDGAGRALMQLDGNFVVYDRDDVPVWHAGTHGHNGAWLLVQNDGNVVIYAADGSPLWATDTVWAD